MLNITIRKTWLRGPVLVTLVIAALFLPVASVALAGIPSSSLEYWGNYGQHFSIPPGEATIYSYTCPQGRYFTQFVANFRNGTYYAAYLCLYVNGDYKGQWKVSQYESEGNGKLTITYNGYGTQVEIRAQCIWTAGVSFYMDGGTRTVVASGPEEYQVLETKNSADAAKASADAAKISADLAASRTLHNGQSAAYWAYQAAQAANTPPLITKIQGLNGATCTQGSSFTVIVTASDNGPPSNLRYRAVCGSFDSGWLPSNQITIAGLNSSGPKTVTIMVSDNSTAPDSGNISQSSFTFFKV